MAAVTLALARLAHAIIEYAPWSSGTEDPGRWASAGSWSTDAFAAAVRLPGEPTDVRSDCPQVAETVAALVGVRLRS
jgi:hypothetical protein